MLSIRNARAEDAAALAALAERTFRDAFTAASDAGDIELHCADNFGPDIQQREIEDPLLVTLLGDLDGEPIAFAQIRLSSAVECVAARHPSELFRLYVLSQWHGRGVAQQIMRSALATAKSTGSDRIWLGVWEQNGRALSFYRKFGFEVVGDHPYRFGSVVDRDLVMALELDESSASQACDRAGVGRH